MLWIPSWTILELQTFFPASSETSQVRGAEKRVLFLNLVRERQEEDTFYKLLPRKWVQFLYEIIWGKGVESVCKSFALRSTRFLA